ncbi:hypothetical protein HRbin27_02073 [bacterium HR27]|nr:hypothetical protein HRbin27_02073 [bacterium HR27]
MGSHLVRQPCLPTRTTRRAFLLASASFLLSACSIGIRQEVGTPPRFASPTAT